jgi:hypothetical protein
MLQLFIEIVRLYFIKQSHLYSIMFEQPIELLLVNIQPRKLDIIALCVTPNSNTH